MQTCEGISAQEIEEFIETYGKENLDQLLLSEVYSKFIKPNLHSSGSKQNVSYVRQIRTKKKLDRISSKRPSIFATDLVIYPSSITFQSFYRSIKMRVQQKCTESDKDSLFWIDIFCITEPTEDLAKEKNAPSSSKEFWDKAVAHVASLTWSLVVVVDMELFHQSPFESINNLNLLYNAILARKHISVTIDNANNSPSILDHILAPIITDRLYLNYKSPSANTTPRSSNRTPRGSPRNAVTATKREFNSQLFREWETAKPLIVSTLERAVEQAAATLSTAPSKRRSLQLAFAGSDEVTVDGFASFSAESQLSSLHLSSASQDQARETVDPEDPFFAGEIYAKLQQWRAAEKHFKLAFHQRLVAYGAAHPQTLRATASYANAALQSQDRARAEELLDSHRIHLEKLVMNFRINNSENSDNKPHSDVTVNTNTSASSSPRNGGRTPRILKNGKIKPAPDSTASVSTPRASTLAELKLLTDVCFELAVLEDELRRPMYVREHLTQCVSLCRAHSAEGDSSAEETRLKTLSWLSALYLQENEESLARACLEEMLQRANIIDCQDPTRVSIQHNYRLRDLHARRGVTVLQAMEHLARLYLAAGQTADAETLLRELLRVYQRFGKNACDRTGKQTLHFLSLQRELARAMHFNNDSQLASEEQSERREAVKQLLHEIILRAEEIIGFVHEAEVLAQLEDLSRDAEQLLEQVEDSLKSAHTREAASAHRLRAPMQWLRSNKVNADVSGGLIAGVSEPSTRSNASESVARAHRDSLSLYAPSRGDRGWRAKIVSFMKNPFQCFSS